MLETLRLARSEYVYGLARAPVSLEGFTVPEGWLIRVCLTESHRFDPPFEDAARFDPGRHLRTRFRPAEFAPFGLDSRGCLGARLTLELGRTFIEARSEFTPALVASGPPVRGTRHGAHWLVNPDFRIALEPVT